MATKEQDLHMTSDSRTSGEVTPPSDQAPPSGSETTPPVDQAVPSGSEAPPTTIVESGEAAISEGRSDSAEVRQ